MRQNFIEGRGEQRFLLPPDVRDWVPADHLSWFVIDAVGRLDLEGFYSAYRLDGHGRAAYEPSMVGRIQPVLSAVESGHAGAVLDGDGRGERKNERGRSAVGVGMGGASPDLQGGSAGGGAVKVASLLFPRFAR
jgi:hypothetical protein